VPFFGQVNTPAAFIANTPATSSLPTSLFASNTQKTDIKPAFTPSFSQPIAKPTKPETSQATYEIFLYNPDRGANAE
jgi:hypothetical protein